MLATEKRTDIELPISIILTDSGMDFFIKKGYKLNKIILADGTYRYGVKLNPVNPSFIQHMVHIGYLSQIEFYRPEFTSKRLALMDLSKLIIFGMFYKQFDAAVFDLLLKSSMVKKWNRANPSNFIDVRSKFNEPALQNILKKHSRTLKEIRSIITGPLRDRVAHDDSLHAGEKNTLIFMADRFLDNIRPLSWFLFVRFNVLKNHRIFIEELRRCLDIFLKRSPVADYFTLLLMELAISAETLNLVAYIEQIHGKVDASSVLASANRDELWERMIKDKRELSIVWKLDSSYIHSIGAGRKLELIIYNSGAEYLELKEKVSDNLRAGSEVPLSEFYRRTPTINSEMGFHYLAYLQDACEKVGMHCYSSVHERRSMPTIHLILQF